MIEKLNLRVSLETLGCVLNLSIYMNPIQSFRFRVFYFHLSPYGMF